MVCAERRYNWLRKRLKAREEVWAIFPEPWRLPQLLCLMFCQVTLPPEFPPCAVSEYAPSGTALSYCHTTTPLGHSSITTCCAAMSACISMHHDSDIPRCVTCIHNGCLYCQVTLPFSPLKLCSIVPIQLCLALLLQSPENMLSLCETALFSNLAAQPHHVHCHITTPLGPSLETLTIHHRMLWSSCTCSACLSLRL